MRLSESNNLPESKVLALIYHDFFDYPLTAHELDRWKVGRKYKNALKKTPQIAKKENYFFIKNREKTVSTRKKRERISHKKIDIAAKGVGVLSKVPTILFVGITGSLAMKNAKDISDVDLMIISRKNTLWTSRLIAFFIFKLLGYRVRKSGDSEERNKLCLNIWIDERFLKWKNKNIFTAHEIAQVVPIFNKNKTYEKFIRENNWIKEYWPNALLFQNSIIESKNNASLIINVLLFFFDLLVFVFEPFVYVLQRLHMAEKITNETVEKNMALFHPNDLSKPVVKYFQGYTKTTS